MLSQFTFSMQDQWVEIELWMHNIHEWLVLGVMQSRL